MTTQAEHRLAARSPVPSRPSLGHRGDIQGLRALAVLAVALDHADVPGFSGGFVGVDVFFVISGYLITQLLIREVHRTGGISLVGFYARRARRILPAASVVLVATVVASALLLGYVRAAAVVKDTVWALFFAANVKFSQDQTDYFSADKAPSPLQHYWSLAVEEQFYLVWPLLLLGIVLGVRAFRRRYTERTGFQFSSPVWPTRLVLIVVAVIGAVSLLWSVRDTAASPVAAYFSTFARAWELAAGAGVAVLAPRLARLPRQIALPVGWLGMAAILASVFLYDERTAFPGSAALAPVLGTALVIGGGVGRSKEGVQVALDHPVGRTVGDLSYSFYLWHWPVLVIAAGYVGHDLPVTTNVLLLLGALALSALSYRLVENPWRTARWLSARVSLGLVVYPVAIAVTLAGCLTASRIIDGQVNAAAAAPPITVSDFGDGTTATAPGEPEATLSSDPAIALVQASVAAARDGQAIPGQLSPSLLDLEGDVPDVGACDYDTGMHKLCKRGDVDSDRVMVVLGDSHARAWIPALEEIAKSQGYAAYYLVRPGCNAGQILPDPGTGPFVGCVDWRDWAIDQIKQLKPDVLFLANDMPPGVVDSSGETTTDPEEIAAAMDEGLQETITMLRASTGRIILAGDVPGLPESPGDCLSRRGADLGDCAFEPTDWSRLKTEAAQDAAAKTNVDFIDPTDWFCAAGWCPSVVGSTVTYRDTEHITPEYALQLAEPLREAMGFTPVP